MKPFRSSGQSFNEIPLSDPKKSSFDLSYTNKGSGKIGRLIPVSNKECLPADRLSCDLHSLLRFEPLAVPLLSDMRLRHHQYFVPFRQVWSSFESFITGGKDGYSDSHVVPSVSSKEVMTCLWNAFLHIIKYYADSLHIVESWDEFDIFEIMYSKSSATVFPVGYALNAELKLRVHSANKTSLPLNNTDYVKTLHDINLFHKVVLKFFDNYQVTGYDTPEDLVTQRYGASYVEGASSSLTNDQYPLHFFDIWKYDIQYILDKWRKLGTIQEGDKSSETVFPMIEEFFRDLYDIAITPFLGPSSSWDYLGYPVDFWNKNGYDGIMAPQQYDPTTDSQALYNPNNWYKYNWQAWTGLPFGSYYNSVTYDSTSLIAEFRLNVMASDVDNTVRYSVLPLRVNYRIWYYNYRDQNLEADVLDPDSVAFKSDLGYNYMLTLLCPRCVAWSKDTFTTATLQAYSTNLVVPIRDSATESKLEEDTLEVPIVDLPSGTSTNATVKLPTHFVQQDNSPLASIKGMTLSNLRKVEALAKWLDKNLFIGFQYADQLFSHYNVKYSDARLQIPEYLAGNSEIVSIDVLTNNTSTEQQLAGEQVSRAQGLTRSSVNDFFVEEHGLFMAYVSVLPDQSYPFGIDRSLLMTNKFDIAFPEFAQLGSDIVTTGEVFASGYNADGTSGESKFFKAFGYQGRYYHYKSNFSEQHGELNTSRREYTFARFFSKAPVLDSEFIHCTPNLQMFVSPYSDQFVYDILVNLRAQRALPVYDQVL